MFEKKIWADRIAEFINSREITHADGSTERVTVARAEGQISQEGDAFSAQNMNNLEDRIADAFNNLDVTMRYDAETDMIQIKDSDGTWKDWQSGGLKSYYRIKTVSATSAQRWITVEEISNSGTVLSTTKIAVDPASGYVQPPQQFTGFKIGDMTDSGNTWHLIKTNSTARYNTTNDKNSAQSFTDVSWRYSSSVTYYVFP